MLWKGQKSLWLQLARAAVWKEREKCPHLNGLKKAGASSRLTDPWDIFSGEIRPRYRLKTNICWEPFASTFLRWKVLKRRDQSVCPVASVCWRQRRLAEPRLVNVEGVGKGLEHRLFGCKIHLALFHYSLPQFVTLSPPGSDNSPELRPFSGSCLCRLCHLFLPLPPSLWQTTSDPLGSSSGSTFLTDPKSSPFSPPTRRPPSSRLPSSGWVWQAPNQSPLLLPRPHCSPVSTHYSGRPSANVIRSYHFSAQEFPIAPHLLGVKVKSHDHKQPTLSHGKPPFLAWGWSLSSKHWPAPGLWPHCSLCWKCAFFQLVTWLRCLPIGRPFLM